MGCGASCFAHTSTGPGSQHLRHHASDPNSRRVLAGAVLPAAANAWGKLDASTWREFCGHGWATLKWGVLHYTYADYIARVEIELIAQASIPSFPASSGLQGVPPWRSVTSSTEANGRTASCSRAGRIWTSRRWNAVYFHIVHGEPFLTVRKTCGTAKIAHGWLPGRQ